MTMHTPPENQGQAVEISYGWNDGCLYKRIHDRSEQSTRWYIASDDEEVNDYIESGSEPWNEEPDVATWEACEEPGDDA